MGLLQTLREIVANNSRLIQISIVVLALSTPSSSLHRRFAKSFRAVATLAFCILVAAVLIPYALVRFAITQLERVFHPNIRLKDAMDESDTYAEWREKARKLDLFEGRDIWQSNSPTANSIHHNWELVTDLINNLVQAREDDDPMMALVAIEQSSARNVGGILSKGLYSRTNTGEPKDIVTKLVTEFEKTLDYLIDRSLGSVPDDPLSVSQRAKQLRRSYHIGLGIRASIVGDRSAGLLGGILKDKFLDDDTKSETDSEVEGAVNAIAPLVSENPEERRNSFERLPSFKKARRCSHNYHAALGRRASVFSAASLERGAGLLKQVDDDWSDDEDEVDRLALIATSLQMASHGSRSSNLNTDLAEGDEEDEETEEDEEEEEEEEEEDDDYEDFGNPDMVLDLEDPTIAAIHQQKCFKALKRSRAAYGLPCLCLSGGGKNAVTHLGVVMALLQEDLLPDIVAGTSAGSMTASFIGTHTNEELKEKFTQENLIKHARFGDFAAGVSLSESVRNYSTKGFVYEPRNIVPHVKWFVGGDTTFEEAHKRTGKILNISVTPRTKNASPVLLNYVTAPNVVIYSAVLASAAIPGVFAPARLYVKDHEGNVLPQGGEAGHELYWDGSVAMDIPTAPLREMFNCTFLITAQANPHICPLYFSNRGDVGQPNLWQNEKTDERCALRGGPLFGTLETLLRKVMLSLISFIADLEDDPSTADVLRQTEECDVVMIAKQRLRHYLTIISTPSEEEWPQMLRDGKIAGFRHVAMLRVNDRMTKALAKGVRSFKLEE